MFAPKSNTLTRISPNHLQVMTYASLLTCIPLAYFLWLGLLADNGADI